MKLQRLNAFIWLKEGGSETWSGVAMEWKFPQIGTGSFSHFMICSSRNGFSEILISRGDMLPLELPFRKPIQTVSKIQISFELYTNRNRVTVCAPARGTYCQLRRLLFQVISRGTANFSGGASLVSGTRGSNVAIPTPSDPKCLLNQAC